MGVFTEGVVSNREVHSSGRSMIVKRGRAGAFAKQKGTSARRPTSRATDNANATPSAQDRNAELMTDRAQTYTILIECRKKPLMRRFHRREDWSPDARSSIGNGSDRECECVGLVGMYGPAIVRTDAGGDDAGRFRYCSGRYQNGERKEGGSGVVQVAAGAALLPDAEATGGTAASGIVGSVGREASLPRFCRICRSSAVLILSFFGLDLVSIDGPASALRSITGTASLRKRADSLELFTIMPAVVRRMFPRRRKGSVWKRPSCVVGDCDSMLPKSFTPGCAESGVVSAVVVVVVRMDEERNGFELLATLTIDEVREEAERMEGAPCVVRLRGREPRVACGRPSAAVSTTID
ncbi:hypothetical protein BU17DRAFT_62200 [Hysterangium stoloniferum]|nr:hypothetical protein BU17DRAFT_62200 [Hysterangium stoloniferum]